jgi:hypothetical protein
MCANCSTWCSAPSAQFPRLYSSRLAARPPAIVLAARRTPLVPARPAASPILPALIRLFNFLCYSCLMVRLCLILNSRLLCFCLNLYFLLWIQCPGFLILKPSVYSLQRAANNNHNCHGSLLLYCLEIDGCLVVASAPDLHLLITNLVRIPNIVWRS